MVARRALAVPSLVCALTAAVFWSCLHAGFVNCDDPEFVNTPYLGLSAASLRWMFTNVYFCNYAPLTLLTLAVDCTLWGVNNPLGYHLTNIAFHAANAAMFYWLCLELFAAGVPAVEDRATAAAAALLFSLHPLRVQSVAWVAERRDVVCGFFFLLTLALWVRAARCDERAAARGRAAALGAFLLALLAKAAAVPLPAVLVLLDLWPLRRLSVSPRRWRETAPVWREKIPFFTLSAIFAVIALVAQSVGGGIVSLTRAAPEGRAHQVMIGLVFYLGKTLWPTALSFYDWHWAPVRTAALLGTAATAILLMAAWRWPRVRPALLGALAYQTLMLAPTLGFVTLGHELVADRYSYLSGLAWAVLAGAALREFGRRRRFAAVAVVTVVLALLASATRTQIGVWKDSTTLFRHALRVHPLSMSARPSLAGALMEQGRTGEAILYLEEHLRLYPNDKDVNAALAQIIADTGTTFRDRARFHEQLGLEFAAKVEFDKATWHFERALRYDPSP